MVSERSEGNEEGNGYIVGKPPRGTKGVGKFVEKRREKTESNSYPFLT